MPLIADPGYLVVRAAIEAGVRVEVIPGASALTSALAGSGLPADIVSFVGFAPAREGERSRFFSAFANNRGTLVFFEAPHRLRHSLEALRNELGDRRIAVAHELTKVHESWHRGFVSELLVGQDLPEKGEFTIVVGEELQESEAPATVNPPVPEAVCAEFGELTKNKALDRREALTELARRHKLPKRAIYSLIERGKKLAK